MTYFSFRAKCWLMGGVGVQFPRNLSWSENNSRNSALICPRQNQMTGNVCAIGGSYINWAKSWTIGAKKWNFWLSRILGTCRSGFRELNAKAGTVYVVWITLESIVRDLSEISRGEGMETEGGSQLFETAEKGWVMKNGPLKGGGSCKYVSVIM